MYKISQFIVFLTLITGLLSCNRNTNKKTDDPVTPVTVTKVNLSKAIFYNSYPANAVALKEVDLRGQVSGYITRIYFTEGKNVYSGQKLYEIDRRKFQAAFEEAQTNVKIAEADLEKVQRDADRYADLSQQDAVPKQLFENSLTDLKTTKQKVTVANSELLKAKIDFDYSLINAPFNGTIGFSNVKMGTLITPGQTLLNTVSSDDPMGIDFEISENELIRFQNLESATFQNNDTTFRIILPNGTTYPFAGKLSVIDRAVNPQTASIKIRISVPNPKRIIKPGMSCNVLVLNANAGQNILIPYKAVMEQLGEYFVFIVKDNAVNQVKVKLGPRVTSDVIVLTGLSGGETIVVDGIQKMHDGSVIKIAPPQNNYIKSKKT